MQGFYLYLGSAAVLLAPGRAGDAAWASGQVLPHKDPGQGGEIGTYIHTVALGPTAHPLFVRY